MNTDYKCVTTVDGIRDYIGGSRIVAFDFETAPDDPYREEEKAALDPAKAHIAGCSFSVKAGTGIYAHQSVQHRPGLCRSGTGLGGTRHRQTPGGGDESACRTDSVAVTATHSSVSALAGALFSYIPNNETEVLR